MNHLPDTITIQQLPDVSDNETVDESEPDAEEEIDQLDSDSDTPPDQQSNPPVVKKPPQSKAGERRPGQTLLPAVRIENILQADGVLGNLNLSKEGVFLLSIATEEFIRRLVKAGHQRASEQNRTMVRYHDMATAARTQYEFKFLQDTIPTPRTLSSALALRTKREQELLEDDPAMQFQNGRARPQRQSGMPQALSTPTASVDSYVPITESRGDGLQCLNSGTHPSEGVVPNDKTLPLNTPNTDPEAQPPKKKLQCARRSYTPSTRPQPKKNGVPVPQNPYPNPTASTSAITEPAQTWEEWREKSRRLYGTGDELRRRNAQIVSSQPNGTSSSSQPITGESVSSDLSHSYPPIGQWDKSEPLHEQAEHTEKHRSPSFEHQKAHLPIALLNGDSRNSPPRQHDDSHENPSAYIPSQEPWTGPLTGPGSAFLQGPGGPFPRPIPPASSLPPTIVGPASPAAPAPGRTIYSLDNPME